MNTINEFKKALLFLMAYFTGIAISDIRVEQSPWYVWLGSIVIVIIVYILFDKAITKWYENQGDK